MTTVGRSAIDLNQLLLPISDDKPCGDDLRYDGIYDEVKGLRQSADTAMIEPDEERSSDWQSVIEVISDALATRTKDLQLAAWLTEALFHQHGFGGLAQGLGVVNGLLRDFWKDVHPLAGEENLQRRVGPLVFLTEADKGSRIPNFVRDLPLAPIGSGGEVYSWNFWNNRTARVGANDDEDAIERKRAESEDRSRRFQQAVERGNRDYYGRLHGDVVAAQEALKEFDRLTDERLGDIAPGTTAFRESLEACENLVRRIFKEKGGFAPASTETNASSPEPTETDMQSSPAVRSGGGFTLPSDLAGGGREQVLDQLSSIAAYFRRNEPQSPIPYLIDRAVAWGRMPFHALLDELVSDESIRNQARKLLGLSHGDGEPPPSESE